METILAIRTRRSIRSFKKRTVQKDKINKILECGLAAPSSKNSNPWYFLVTEGKKKNKIADWVKKEAAKSLETAPIDPETGKIKAGIEDTTAASIKIILEAPVLILIFNRAPFTGGMAKVIKYISDSGLYTLSVEILGLGTAIQNMLLASHDLGLGAVFMSDLYPAAQIIKKAFKIKYDFIGAIAIGYPAYRLPPRKLKEGLVKFV